jgi:hypothetical protein
MMQKYNTRTEEEAIETRKRPGERLAKIDC